MSYDIARSWSINVKKRSIKYNVASNNLRDWNDRLVFEKGEMKYETPEQFRRAVFATGNNILGGMLRVPNNSPLHRRMVYLKEHNMLNYEMTRFGDAFLRVPETQEVFEIIAGIKRVHVPVYELVDEYGRKVVYGTAQISLGYYRRATKFVGNIATERALKRCDGWQVEAVRV